VLVEMAKEKGQIGYDAASVKRLIEEFILEVQKNDENEDVELSERGSRQCPEVVDS